MKTTPVLLTALLAFPLATLSPVAVADSAKKSATSAKKTSDEQTDWGKPGKANKQTRTIKVDMTDAMRFTPANIEVQQNETVRFLITNSGKIKHEMVLGTEKELKEHYEVMKKNPEMEHDDPNMVTLAPGKSGEVVWQFTKAGKVDFACLQPGHYDAGMKGEVKVAKAAAKTK